MPNTIAFINGDLKKGELVAFVKRSMKASCFEEEPIPPQNPVPS